jgi:hypothetical protein
VAPRVGTGSDGTRSRGAALNKNEHDGARLAAELRQNGSNLARAAEAAGISRQRAYRLLAGRSVAAFLADARSDGAGDDDEHSRTE